MYRRINEVFQFNAPNYLERLEIWKLVTSHKAVPCDPSIDWESIALKYELTGGFIKNAVISALLDGVGRDPKTPQITETDILNGCKKQVRGALQMVDFNERVVPKEGLSSLIVSEPVMDKLSEIVSLEKARGILFGSWGFDEDMRYVWFLICRVVTSTLYTLHSAPNQTNIHEKSHPEPFFLFFSFRDSLY